MDTKRQSKSHLSMSSELEPLNFENQQTSAHLLTSRLKGDVGLKRRQRSSNDHTNEKDNAVEILGNSAMETEFDSTASTPPSPIGEHSDLPSTVARTEHQARVAKLLGATRRVNLHTSEIRGHNSEVDKQFKSTTTKSSPVKIIKHLKIKRRQGSRASSEVWDHFTPQESDNGPVAVCNYCQQVYKCDRATHGTSTLRKHLTDLCKLSPFWDPEKRRKLASGNNTPKHHFSIEDCRRALAKMVIIDEMPFNVVEGEGFREYSATLEPRFDLPSRITVARDCLKIYMEEKARLKKSMNGHRICLTTDTWTSIQNLCYMSLTAHWIDHEWKLQKRILNFCLVPDHKGDTIGEKIEECLLEWGIGSIFTITVDNASSNDSAVSYLKKISKDWEGTILKNEFLHIRCCAHIVNLIVKSGLKCIDKSITNWWKVNSNKYPILSKLAKAVLAVPVSTVASESAFSTGGRVISSFRSSLSPKMVESLICAQSWMRSSPKDLDIEEIIKDLQNCEELEDEMLEPVKLSSVES